MSEVNQAAERLRLSDYLAKSCKELHRSPYDLLRCIAAFIPDDHPLASSAMRDLDSMSFSPPELLPMFYCRFMDDMREVFPEDKFDAAPLWVRAISVLILAGKTPRDEFERWFQ